MSSAVTGSNELLDLFTRYNEDLWPGHVPAYLTGIACAVLLFPDRRGLADRLIPGLLAALWLWLGVVFQGLYATDVDETLGAIHAGLFLVQAVLLLRVGVLRGELAFASSNGASGALGWVALAYAIAVAVIVLRDRRRRRGAAASPFAGVAVLGAGRRP